MSVRTALTLISAVTLASAAVAAGAASPAVASGGYVSCETTGYNPATRLNSWECDLYDTAPSNEVWRGPWLSSASNGTTVATGYCRPVTPTYAYYVTVNYVNAGVPTSASSNPFLCGNQF